MRYFLGTALSSVRYQPPTSAFVPDGLKSSRLSSCGGSVCVRISLMTIGGRLGTGSSAPGEPPGKVLARQLVPLSGAWDRPGFFGTKENPSPSAVLGQGNPLS